MTDCRHIHPAYSEAHRFSMMEAQLQSLLKRKHLPLPCFCGSRCCLAVLSPLHAKLCCYVLYKQTRTWKWQIFPPGVLSYLEDEMIEIFAHDPLSVYITSELSSFERLLLHALCQYYFLRSKSTTIAGVRRTKVENANKCFHEPDISLATYIDKFYRRSKAGVHGP